MPLLLRWRDATRLAVEVDVLRPDALAGDSPADVSKLSARAGNTSVELGELFNVSGHGGDGLVRIEGDVRHVARIGERMRGGRIEIFGDAGPHLGAGMLQGLIQVHGNAAAWAGAEMRGGRLVIRGDAGDWLGAAYPGSRLGMRDGVILVYGSAGGDVGLSMRRGLIAAAGDLGPTPGRALVAGTVFGFGGVGLGAGLGMKRGSIVLFGNGASAAQSVLPSFACSGTASHPWVSIYLKQLLAWNFPLPGTPLSPQLTRYNGDMAEAGQGELLIAEYAT